MCANEDIYQIPLNSNLLCENGDQFFDGGDALLFEFSETQAGLLSLVMNSNFRLGNVQNLQYWYGLGSAPEIEDLSLDDFSAQYDGWFSSGGTGGNPIVYQHMNIVGNYDWVFFIASGSTTRFLLSSVISEAAPDNTGDIVYASAPPFMVLLMTPFMAFPKQNVDFTRSE